MQKHQNVTEKRWSQLTEAERESVQRFMPSYEKRQLARKKMKYEISEDGECVSITDPYLLSDFFSI